MRQAEFKKEQASVELSAAQRQLVRNLQESYAEAQTAREQMDLLRSAVDLASESLRLTVLRYQAGEATILELVDAQTALIQSRNAYDDGILRYRVAQSSNTHWSVLEMQARVVSLIAFDLLLSACGKKQEAEVASPPAGPGYGGDAKHHPANCAWRWRSVPAGTGQRGTQNYGAGAEVLRPPRRPCQARTTGGGAGESRSGRCGHGSQDRHRGGGIQFARNGRLNNSGSRGKSENGLGGRPACAGQRQESAG